MIKKITDEMIAKRRDALMDTIRKLYTNDPGSFEMEMQGEDQWSDDRVKNAIEDALSELKSDIEKGDH
jgi:hypothetical protein